MDKIAFIIHTKEMYHHYANVFRMLNPNELDVVLFDHLLGDAEFMGKLSGINTVPLSSVHGAYKYRYLVSNHYMDMNGGTSLIKRIGECNIRFMYGLGDAKWNYADWNALYDYILCFGPYQAERLDFTGGVKLQMGYPRYDAYFQEKPEREPLQRKFGCNPGKKTIVWLPTRGKLSSVPIYLSAMSALTDRFNIVLKPHPLDLEEGSGIAASLRGAGLTHLIDYMVDNTELYQAADYILADYGGIIFSALYLDKNLLLLNVPGAESDPNIGGSNSEDIVIRGFLRSVDPGERDRIGEILSDEREWQMQKIKRGSLRKIFFASYDGCSAAVAASTLNAIRQIENKKGLFARSNG
ncbi:CDP-glycerol glycerophosphotransferase family protein [Geomonas sp. RF6]|uniref:CDP-glycerol glycerophosphotransferase family protein n=1 Tax=Geomonas sp. RF6 TaxID=2897342 RepID=UPI001E4A321C|nr:CDP-glycerol glycerophosphotransferase family protein [Geomonas sp. RF6]UFS72434.1 CDP-glycerol glycerophosphotransferase family protein [Geomonas sp. RF6]